MHRINSPAQVANTGRVKIDAGEGVNIDVPVTPYAPYDSGERDITSLVPGVVSGALHTQRIGWTVWIDFRDLVCADPTSAWHEWKGLLPTGFRPSRSWKYLPLTARTNAFTAGPARISAGGDLLIYDVAGQKIMRGLISFPTPDAPPSTPPGSNP